MPVIRLPPALDSETPACTRGLQAWAEGKAGCPCVLRKLASNCGPIVLIGLRAEEIAARLGVSRAALYRYEKGEVIKLDTIKRLAELLKISPLSLLGIGVEYYNRPIGYFEQIRQMEETADQILQLFGPVCYLTTSDAYDNALAEAFDEAAEQAAGNGRPCGRWPNRCSASSRRASGCTRCAGRDHRHGVTFLGAAVARPASPAGPVSDRVRRICRDVAVTEVENMAALMEAEPMGLQFGLLAGPNPRRRSRSARTRPGQPRRSIRSAPIRIPRRTPAWR